MTDPNKNESTAHNIDLSIIIERYLKYSFDDQYHRYKSWEHCFAAFASNTDQDFLALHLGFYLASWGMYRGSSGLLQKSYQIHNKAVAILKSKPYQQLQCNATHEITAENIPLLFELKNELAAHYSSIGFTRGNKTALKITATDTLISKVLLGTLGCVPAFDKYFCKGLKQSGIKNITFEKKSLEYLLNFTQTKHQAVTNVQRSIKDKTGIYYPVMKIIDMYFWQIGYDYELEKK